jgi:cell division protein FtsQ
MADKRLISSILKLSGLLVGAGVLVFLLVAAVRIRSEQICKDVAITFTGPDGGKYVGRTDVAGQMWPGGIPALKGKPLEEINLSLMEERIEQDPWVRNAELFIDAGGRLQVVVEEKRPVARVFNREGQSFYLDEKLEQIPLNRYFTPNLPVFTGLPLRTNGRRANDSLLLTQVLEIASAMQDDSLWMAQMEQCAYEPPFGFVMYPLAGDHRILFGGAERTREKFRNLFVFYTQVLAREGWNLYRTIDLRFSRQVVVTPVTPPKIPSDSLGMPVSSMVQPEDTTAQATIDTLTIEEKPATKRTPKLVMPAGTGIL